MPSSFLEKTLEDIIFENRDVIHTYGVPRLRHNTYRQFYLPSGKKLDIVSFSYYNKCLWFDIWELKRDIVDFTTFNQAYGYYKELKALLAPKFEKCEFSMVLIGKTAQNMSFLDDFNIRTHAYTYDYGINGINFSIQKTPELEITNDEYFVPAIYAFATGMLHYTLPPSSIAIGSSYKKYVNGDPQMAERVLNILSYKEPSGYIYECTEVACYNDFDEEVHETDE